MALEQGNFISEPSSTSIQHFNIGAPCYLRNLLQEFYKTSKALALAQNDYGYRASGYSCCYAAPAVQRWDQGAHYDARHVYGPGPRYPTDLPAEPPSKFPRHSSGERHHISLARLTTPSDWFYALKFIRGRSNMIRKDHFYMACLCRTCWPHSSSESFRRWNHASKTGSWENDESAKQCRYWATNFSCSDVLEDTSRSPAKLIRPKAAVGLEYSLGGLQLTSARSPPS